MTKMRKVKRSLISALLLWMGRRLLGRVQKRTLRTITRKPVARRGRPRRRQPAPAAPPVARSRFPRKRAAQGLAVTVLSAAAVAAIKAGVEHVIESEREQQVVTPDFDVFADDDE